MSTATAINTDRVIRVDSRGEHLVISIMADSLSIDGMVIAISRADWDQLVDDANG